MGLKIWKGQVHVLFDEYSLEARVLHNFPVALEAAKQNVKSLWISIGSIDSNL